MTSYPSVYTITPPHCTPVWTKWTSYSPSLRGEHLQLDVDDIVDTVIRVVVDTVVNVIVDAVVDADNDVRKNGTIFVGDSLDDLPPLYLKPTMIGVIAGDSEKVTATLQQV